MIGKLYKLKFVKRGMPRDIVLWKLHPEMVSKIGSRHDLDELSIHHLSIVKFTDAFNASLLYVKNVNNYFIYYVPWYQKYLILDSNYSVKPIS